MKKVLALISVFILAATAMVGCSSDSGSSDGTTAPSTTANAGGETTEGGDPAPVEKEDFTITMLYSDNANYAYDEDWMIWDIIYEATGCIIDPIPTPESDYNTKVQTAFNTGELPDVVTKYFVNNEEINSGMVLAMSDYWDQMPNFQAYVEEYGVQEYLDITAASDGKTYFVPTKANKFPMASHNWMIRTDVFAENNIPVPTTLDEVYEAGLKLKEIYPESTPITNRFSQANLMEGIGRGFDVAAGWGFSAHTGMLYDHDAGTWEFSPTTQNWREMVTYMNNLYTNGVLDIEWNTLDSTVYEQKVTTGQTFILYDWSQNVIRYHNEGRKTDEDFTIETIVAPEGPYDHAINPAPIFTQQWAVSSSIVDKDYFDNFLAFLDWGYTDEAEIAMTFGQEGVSYEITEEGTYNWIDQANNDWYAKAGLDNNSLTIRQHEDTLYAQISTNDVAALDEQVQYLELPQPSSPLNAEEQEQFVFECVGLSDYVTTNMMAFIEGQTPITDETWAEYVAGCEDKGSIWLDDTYNAAEGRR